MTLSQALSILARVHTDWAPGGLKFSIQTMASLGPVSTAEYIAAWETVRQYLGLENGCASL